MRKLGDYLAVLLCKKTCVLVHVPGEILERAPPTPSGRAPHYSRPAVQPQVAPSGGTPRKASGSFVFLSLKRLLCTRTATGCKLEAEGMEMHRAESFSLLSRKRQEKKAQCCVGCWKLPGQSTIHVSQKESKRKWLYGNTLIRTFSRG